MAKSELTKPRANTSSSSRRSGLRTVPRMKRLTLAFISSLAMLIFSTAMSLVGSIFIEASPAFASVQSDVHHFFQQRARSVIAVIKSLVKNLDGIQDSVQTDQVGGFQRA